MRIISGKFGGRRFEVPKSGMRPTKDQVREAVFSSMAARVPAARVLDLFAGAGGYGLEALSRGAAHVTAVEKAPAHFKFLHENFQQIAGDGSVDWKTVQADVYDFLKSAVGVFNLIFADPPYDEADLPKLAASAGGVLAPDGLLVFEMRSTDAYSLPPELTLIKEKKYGESRVLFLEKTANE